jgi:hypothetical protein
VKVPQPRPSHTETTERIFRPQIPWPRSITQQRRAQNPGLDLLSPRDVVEMLNETLPRKPDGKNALV